MTERRDLSPGEKIDWLLQRSILHDRSARHEVFRALQVSYPGADPEQRTAVVQEIMSERRSRVEGDGERIAAAYHFGVFRNPGGKSGSPGDTDGVEIKAAEMKVDGVAESLAVAEAAR